MLTIILVAVVLTFLAIGALSIRLFFKKESNLQSTCQPKYSTGDSSTGDVCGCGECGCGIGE